MIHVEIAGKLVHVREYEKCKMLSFPFRCLKYNRTMVNARRIDTLALMRRKFMNIVSAMLDAEKQKPAWVTLTFRDEVFKIVDAYAELKPFVMKMKYHFPNFRYVCVPEFQRSGRVHFHILAWGIPQIIISESIYAKEERKRQHKAGIPLELRYQARLDVLWGNGFVDAIFTDGSTKLAGYMSKYMLKAIADPRTYGQKGYTRTRGMDLRIIVGWLPTFGAVDPAVAVLVFKNRPYQTKYWGVCSYYMFELVT